MAFDKVDNKKIPSHGIGPVSPDFSATFGLKIRELCLLVCGQDENRHIALLDAFRHPQQTYENMRALEAVDLIIKAVKSRQPLSKSKKNDSVKHHEKERLLQTAFFSHLGEGTIILDGARRIFSFNTKARDLLGLSEKERVRGADVGRIFKLEDRNGDPIPPEKNPIEKAIETFEPVRIGLMGDLYCRKKGGDSFPVTLTASPVSFHGSKKIKGIIITFNDITQEKKMDEVKSDFIYIASHQLRTPLTVSTLHTEMLLAGHGGDLTKDQREFLTEIQYYNKKMAQLLSVFMTVSKIELGTFVLQEKPTDLRQVMDDVIHELTTQIKSKKLNITRHYPEAAEIAYTDPEFIRIVFQNLVSNAVKYTPHEGLIELSIYESGNGHVAIDIKDSGCGIPKEEQSRVFTKLYRGSNTQKHRWESNGLGLYLTKSIVDKCGGTISFISEERKGTTFHVLLPSKNPATLSARIM